MRLRQGDTVVDWSGLGEREQTLILQAFEQEGAQLHDVGDHWDMMGWLQDSNIIHGINRGSFNDDATIRFVAPAGVLDSYAPSRGDEPVPEFRVHSAVKLTPSHAYSVINAVLISRREGRNVFLTVSEHVWGNMPAQIRDAVRGTPADFQHDSPEEMERKFFQYYVLGGDV